MWEHSELQKEIETPVLLAHAIEDSTDIFGIFFWGGGVEPPKPPPSVRHCHELNIDYFKTQQSKCWYTSKNISLSALRFLRAAPAE